ncbi:MAG: 16S rRNA (uracil(1498)-N(3))-methyltransferase [Gammaproteobacteria bacterium]
MTLSRIYVEDSLHEGAVIQLARDRAHYVHRVLRLGADDAVRVFNSRDGEYAARLIEVSGARASVRIETAAHSTTESPLAATLVQGLCRSQRMDYCVQKATEVGVTRIVPLITERCVVRLDERRAAKRLSHWQAIAQSACEQSGRTCVPDIETPIRLADLVSRAPIAGPVLLDPDAGERFGDWQFDGDALSLMVGPEGGFTADETRQLIDLGAARWRMGPRVLRTETAGVVALALAQAKWGDLA